jgi:hypothetical protein
LARCELSGRYGLAQTLPALKSAPPDGNSVAPADAEAQIRSFLEAIEPMMGSSLVTLGKVQVLRYGPDAT